MNNNFLISNTNDFGNTEIKKYMGIVSTHIVIGANFFADFFASFTDFFGGHSSAYQERLEEMFGEAKKNLIKEAKQRGANGIIGFTIDFDEISGKDKSMFMVSAIGTAVSVNIENESQEENSFGEGRISSRKLSEKIARMTLVQKVQCGYMPTKEDWPVIIAYIPELAEHFIDLYVVQKAIREDGAISSMKNSDFELLQEHIFTYVSSIDLEKAAQILYPRYTGTGRQSRVAFNVIKQCGICYFLELQRMFANYTTDNSHIVDLLSVDKAYYDRNDLKAMEDLKLKIENLPSIRQKKMVSSGIFSKKTEELEVCACGHKFTEEREVCPNCMRDKKGFTSQQRDIITTFNQKIAALKELL